MYGEDESKLSARFFVFSSLLKRRAESSRERIPKNQERIFLKKSGKVLHLEGEFATIIKNEKRSK